MINSTLWTQEHNTAADDHIQMAVLVESNSNGNRLLCMPNADRS